MNTKYKKLPAVCPCCGQKTLVKSVIHEETFKIENIVDVFDAGYSYDASYDPKDIYERVIVKYSCTNCRQEWWNIDKLGDELKEYYRSLK